MIIHQCPNCMGTLTEKGIRWSCDDYHPEVLAQLGHTDPFARGGRAGGIVNGITEHDAPRRKDSTPDGYHEH